MCTDHCSLDACRLAPVPTEIKSKGPTAAENTLGGPHYVVFADSELLEAGSSGKLTNSKARLRKDYVKQLEIHLANGLTRFSLNMHNLQGEEEQECKRQLLILAGSTREYFTEK